MFESTKEKMNTIFFHVVHYKTTFPQGQIQVLEQSPDPLVGTEPCLQTTIPE